MGEGAQAPVAMIRRDRWKFAYSAIDPPMLFDLVADPKERANLVAGLPIPRAACQASQVKDLCVQGPNGLPTPDGTPFTSPMTKHTTVVSFPFGSPTSPRPSHLKPARELPHAADPATLLAYFLEEINAHWNREKIRQDVLHSQRRRRLVYSTLIKGKIQIWDYEPRIDPNTRYVCNQGKCARPF